MTSTTIRVDTDTHAQLVALSNDAGVSITETVRRAAEALRRARFARTVAAEYASLRQDELGWASYLAEAAATEVDDGLD